jgi:hypothetical protein
VKTINIKGKEYVPVNERVLYFRGTDEYKDWSIITEIVSFDADVAVVKASVVDANGVVKATGHAFETQSDKLSFVNKTSYLENAETSAVGRALGLLGIGIDAAFASADEVRRAQDQSSNPDLEKPWLSELQYSKVMERLRANDPGEFETVQKFAEAIFDKYRIKKIYRDAISIEVNK